MHHLQDKKSPVPKLKLCFYKHGNKFVPKGYDIETSNVLLVENVDVFTLESILAGWVYEFADRFDELKVEEFYVVEFEITEHCHRFDLNGVKIKEIRKAESDSEMIH